MAVDIKSLLYAGVWREPWPEVVNSGGIAPDFSGAGRHGASVDQSTSVPDNKMTWEAVSGGRYGARQGFTYVVVPPLGPIRAVAGWFGKPLASHSGYAEQFSGGLGWGFYLRNGAQLRLQLDGILHQYLLPENPNDGAIHHFAAAWDDDTAYMWFDGSLVYSAAASPPTYSALVDVRLGTSTSAASSGNYILTPGIMADVVLRDTPWTDAEVAWLANPANDLRATGGGIRRQLLSSPHLIGSLQ